MKAFADETDRHSWPRLLRRHRLASGSPGALNSIRVIIGTLAAMTSLAA
ncbi:MAG: hypothetical protein RMK30_08250 [Anaerolineae bacterium]|nr:hypothetical protein [Anaerolineae bacterium]